MKTQLKKHTIEQDTWKVSNALQEQLMYPNCCRPADGRRGIGPKEGMKNPELPVEKKNTERNNFSSSQNLLVFFCPFFFFFVSAEAEKATQVQIN